MKERGFTLIELLVAMVIMAIIAVIAIPNYQRKVSETRQNQAKAHLMAIAQTMEMYKLQYGTYAASLTNGNFAWAAPSDSKYTFSLPVHTTITFTAQASGNIDGDATSDVWTIDQDSTLTNTTNDVSG
jgi:prepilin-type N-terminal cleavage/methylation domain-containing protein